MSIDRKLLFFDIDGTLMTEGEKRFIPKSALDAVEKARQRGHYAFINTGRTMAELGEEIRGLQFDGFVCGCGTAVYFHGECILHVGIEDELMLRLVRDLREYRLEGLLEGEEYIYYDDRAYHSRMALIRKEHEILVPQNIKSMNDALAFDKFCFCVTQESDFTGFYEKYKDKFTFIDRGQGFYEVVPMQCSKASAMQYLAKRQGCAIQDIIAFGDSTNDVAMLAFAGTAVVMGKHDAEILQYADYVTSTVEEDGIARAMEHLGLIGELC